MPKRFTRGTRSLVCKNEKKLTKNSKFRGGGGGGGNSIETKVEYSAPKTITPRYSVPQELSNFMMGLNEERTILLRIIDENTLPSIRNYMYKL